MHSREYLVSRLLYLIPNAKFSLWPDERESQDDELDAKGYDNLILMDGWVIYWEPNNTASFPTWEQINDVTDEQIAEKELYEKKHARDKEMAANLIVVSNYRAYFNDHPEISFSAYLDMLEEMELDA